VRATCLKTYEAGAVRDKRLDVLVWFLPVLTLTIGCGQPPSPAAVSDQQQAEGIARQFLQRETPQGYVDRAVVDIRPSHGGWMVVFHDLNVPCDQAHWGPDLCGMPAAGLSTPVPSVFRDVYVCVSADLMHLGSVGGAPTTLDQTDRCAPSQPPPVQPTATAQQRG
jgi:hypothetical protein